MKNIYPRKYSLLKIFTPKNIMSAVIEHPFTKFYLLLSPDPGGRQMQPEAGDWKGRGLPCVNRRHTGHYQAIQEYHQWESNSHQNCAANNKRTNSKIHDLTKNGENRSPYIWQRTNIPRVTMPRGGDQWWQWSDTVTHFGQLDSGQSPNQATIDS